MTFTTTCGGQHTSLIYQCPGKEGGVIVALTNGELKRYDEAERIKMKADLLEEFERNKLEAEMQAVIEKKEAKLRHTQQLALAALLKRIQRDRNE